MKTIKRLWRNVPRKVRIVLNLLAVLLLAGAAYIILGCPAFTPEQQFRRMEKANLVGPADIIETIDAPNGDYDHILVADDGDAVILYSYDNPITGRGSFLYREKSGDITILPVPNHQYLGSSSPVIDLPVLVFHEYPGAHRAELELHFGEGLGIQETQWQQGEEVNTGIYEKSYFLEARRETDGYFRFDLHIQSKDWYVDEQGVNHGSALGRDGFAIEILCRMMTKNRAYLYEYVPATVRLYDAEGGLIVEEDLTIRSVSGAEYAQREGLEP